MQLLLRILGLNLLSQVGVRLPNSVVRTLSSLALIAANLLPIKAVMDGSLGLGDVFVLYWLENVVIWFTTTIRILTARGGTPVAEDSLVDNTATATFFAIHFGIFTLVHGVLSFTLAGFTGWFLGSPLYWLVVVAAMLASHVISLGLNWFGLGERDQIGPAKAMWLPYPRMLVLHGGILAAFFLVLRPNGAEHSVTAVALLCWLKLLADLGFHLRERFALRVPRLG